MNTTVEKQQEYADILEQFPELIEQLKNPDKSKKRTKREIGEEFNGEVDDGTGKIKYKNKEDAEKALKSCRANKKTNKHRKEKRIYMDDNGFWYLTSKTKDKEKSNKKRKMINTKHTYLISTDKNKKKK